MKLSRRECLRIGLAASGALLVGWRADAGTSAANDVKALGLWLLIGSDSSVTLRTNASEMGQGSNSALAQIVAEELEFDPAEIRLVMAPIEPQYFGVWNDYVTGGSGTVRGMFDKLRVAAATARELLVSAAASDWNVSRKECAVDRRATIVHRATRRSLRFGELAARAANITLEHAAEPKPREQWRLIGQSVQRIDLQDKVSGAAKFGIDTNVPTAMVAVIRQAPQFGAKLKEVLKAGNARIVQLPDAVAIVATDYWSAKKAADATEIEWTSPQKIADADGYRRELRAALDAEGEIKWVDEQRHAELRAANVTIFKSATRVVEAEYEVPLLAHVCMEPMNATAHVTATSATLWVPTQVQASMRRDVAKALGLPESAVTIETTLLGGGFGRRLATDYGVQAALTAREIGKPIKLIWSREEDVQHDFYRPAAMGRFRCALNSDNEIEGLRTHLAALGGCNPAGMPPYDLPNWLITNVAIQTPIPLGAWRAVECNHNTFFAESFVDEVAYATGHSPLALRRKLLHKDARALRTLNAAVEASGMETGTDRTHFFGVALCSIFGSVAAHVVEISRMGERSIRIHRITCALDCGTAVNPDSVQAQIEGGIIMALSATCMEKINIREGRVAQSNFHDYPILRFNQVPEIKTVLLSSPSEEIGGCGEPPVPPLAPALTNAIFAATGVRVRKLPLFEEGWELV